jgi:5-methylcytosine-specific restriction protein A
MSHLYKQAKVCDCGYTTLNRGSWSLHTNKRCKLVKEQIIQGENSRIALLEKQLAAKNQELKDQREEIKIFEQLLAERFVELKEEVKQLRKRKAAPSRVGRSEPQRRKIAQRQNWKCASTSCNLAGELEAYDVDHIIPLWKGGEDTDENLQALCPACHRRKTDLERLEYEALNH